MTREQASALATELRAVSEATRRLAVDFSRRELSEAPSPGCWSAGENLMHLTLASQAPVPRMTRTLGKLAEAGKRTDGPSRADWVGSLYAWALEPRSTSESRRRGPLCRVRSRMQRTRCRPSWRSRSGCSRWPRRPWGSTSARGRFKEGVANEVPVHRVCLTKAFDVDVHEVTNADYRACVATRRCSAPGKPGSKTRASYYGNPQYDRFPVVNVDWKQASAYCAWQGKRLPSEAEWEYAARGGLAGKRYPRGDSLSCADANWGRGEGLACRGNGGLPNDTHAVGRHAANGYGLHDMAGNVWEWVNDGYSESYYGETPVNDPPGPEPDYPVVRGGAWSGPANYLRVAYRGNYSPTLQDDLIGFRCVR